jgi:RNA polymerase sigma factor (sigma-70 family)
MRHRSSEGANESELHSSLKVWTSNKLSPFDSTGSLIAKNMNGLSDIDLLDSYAKSRSEEAFQELVTRHVDFIYSAAMRQLRNSQLAEEATQAAFIALAGKAGRLQPRTVITGWLYHAVHFAALNLQRSEARRKHWEKEAATMNNPHENAAAESTDLFKETALPQVDGALAELGEKDRAALVLRFLQQKSLRDVGETMGTSEEAAKKRVSRALEKLRSLLARRGVVVPAAALAIGLSQLPAFTAPGGLRASLPAIVAKAAIPATTLASALVAQLLVMRAKLIAAFGAIVVCAAVFVLWPRLTANGTPPNPATASGITIKLTSVMVDDQDKALKFYSDILGFNKKRDLLLGPSERWLTVVSSDGPDEIEMLLEPLGFPPARVYQQALHDAGRPWTGFGVDNVQREYARLTQLGINFSLKPTNAGPAIIAIFDDTCGNLIQLFQSTETTNANNGTKNTTNKTAMKIKLNSVMVKDQDKALKFYTENLGFIKKHDMPAGEGRWLTVVSAQEPDGAELLLEPMGFPPGKVFQEAVYKAGIPFTAFAVESTQKEYERLKKLGVSFTMEPTQMGPTTIAVFDDTCGNLIQLFQKYENVVSVNG